MAAEHVLPVAPFSGHGAATAPPRPLRPHVDDPAVGVDYLIEQAGGEAAVLRAAARRLPRVLRQANMLELTEAITMALVALAPDALEQLADGRWRSLDEASRRLAQRAASRRQ